MQRVKIQEGSNRSQPLSNKPPREKVFVFQGKVAKTPLKSEPTQERCLSGMQQSEYCRMRSLKLRAKFFSRPEHLVHHIKIPRKQQISTTAQQTAKRKNFLLQKNPVTEPTR